MASSDFVKKIGTLAHADMLKSGILASIIAAQAILGLEILAEHGPGH